MSRFSWVALQFNREQLEAMARSLDDDYSEDRETLATVREQIALAIEQADEMDVIMDGRPQRDELAELERMLGGNITRGGFPSRTGDTVGP